MSNIIPIKIQVVPYKDTLGTKFRMRGGCGAAGEDSLNFERRLAALVLSNSVRVEGLVLTGALP